MYFAGKKDVAKFYRDELSVKKFNGQAYSDAEPSHLAARRLDAKGGDRDQTIRSFLTDIGISRPRKNSSPGARHQLWITELAVEHVRNKTEAKVTNKENKGHLYEVDLAPKDSELLHWDKPLSEQPAGVRDKLSDRFRFKDTVEARSGKDMYQSMTAEGDPSVSRFQAQKAASVALRDAGIRGIKYLDEGSRGKGEGSSNYVIFNEADVSVTARYMPAGDVKRMVERFDIDNLKDAYDKLADDRTHGNEDLAGAAHQAWDELFPSGVSSAIVTKATASRAGNSRANSSSADMGVEPGRVDSAPRSRKSAPSASIRTARSAIAGISDPSPSPEKESGVTLMTPMT
jgi:hypothetical protein